MTVDNNEKYDIAVIGAGASGLMAAIAGGGAGPSVVLIDGNEKPGKKLYATGNGKCNFTNIKAQGADWTVGLFRRFGMLSRSDEQGRCYPYSGQASTVVSVLEAAAARAGVIIMTGDPVRQIEKKDGAFTVKKASGACITAGSVILATGGRAGLKYGSTGDGYGFAKAFGHTLTPPHPGLVAVESDMPEMKSLKGVRVKCSVTLEKKGRVIAADGGELQFTGTGISGICVFDLTRYMDAARPAKKKKKADKAVNAGDPGQEDQYIIAADMAPDLSADELEGFIAENLARLPDQEGSDKEELMAGVLSGVVNSKLAGLLAHIILPAAGSDSQGKAIPPEQVQLYAKRAAGIIKHFEVPVSHTRGWDDAQVTVGGVRLEEIDGESMESLLEPGLFMCGELLDFDGRCGGYNLQWAWSSGYRAGRSAAAFVLGEDHYE